VAAFVRRLHEIGWIEGRTAVAIEYRWAEGRTERIPQEIVTAGGTPGTSVGSLYQTDEVGLRLRWPISWALRSSNGLAWLTNVNW